MHTLLQEIDGQLIHPEDLGLDRIGTNVGNRVESRMQHSHTPGVAALRHPHNERIEGKAIARDVLPWSVHERLAFSVDTRNAAGMSGADFKILINKGRLYIGVLKHDAEGAGIVRNFWITGADESALPFWLRTVSDDFLVGRIPDDTSKLTLELYVIFDDGSLATRSVKFDKKKELISITV